MNEKSKQDIHLSEYWYVLRRRLWVIVAFTATIVLASIWLTSTMQPVFSASSRIAIEKGLSSSPVTGKRTEYESAHSERLSFNTHFKLITSKPVIEVLLNSLEQPKVEKEHVVAAEPEDSVQTVRSYLKDGHAQLKKNISFLLGRKKRELATAEMKDREIWRLKRKISVRHVKETRLITIKASDHDPAGAALIANQMAKTYIEFDMASRLKAANENLAWLNKEVYAMKERLEEDERKFYEYKQRNKVFSLAGKQKVIDQKISELNNDYLNTRNKRQELDTKLAEIRKQYAEPGDIGYIRSILENKAIHNIYSSLTSLELELGRLSKVFRSKHPKMQQVVAEIGKVKGKLKAELKKEIENLRIQRNILLKREKVMEQTISEFETDALDTSSKELKYTILQRNMDTSQKFYETMVAKIKETGILSTSGASNIRIVERASVPLSPIKPDKRKNILLGFVLGLFGGIGLAFFIEYLDQSIRTEDDVEKYLGCPVLSIIPLAGKGEVRG